MTKANSPNSKIFYKVGKELDKTRRAFVFLERILPKIKIANVA